MENTKINYIKQFVLGAATLLTFWLGSFVSATTTIQEGIEEARPDDVPASLVGQSGVINQLTETALMVIGLVSVFMLIYGGLRYITSGGDAKKVTEAKNTILYALIGLVIAILSFAIVNFVLNLLGAGGVDVPTNGS